MEHFIAILRNYRQPFYSFCEVLLVKKRPKHTIISLLILLFLLLLVSASSPGVPPTTSAAPSMNNPPEARSHPLDFILTDLDGKQFNGMSLQGKIVLLDFWTTWCAPCLAAFPDLIQLQNDLRNKNFEVIGIAVYSGDAGDVKPVVKKYALNYTSLLGGDAVVAKFDVIGFPTYFLISQEGKIYKKYIGHIKDFLDALKTDIVELQNAGK